MTFNNLFIPLFKIGIFVLGTWFFKITATLCYDVAFNQEISFMGFVVFVVCFLYSVVYITYAFALIYSLDIFRWLGEQKIPFINKIDLDR
jgi:hypothetical protein